MCKSEQILYLLRKIERTLIRVIDNSARIETYHYYYLNSSGLERLESTCMLLIAIGESVKGIDKLTGGGLLPRYPDMDWRGIMGIRDVIAHHYFDLDGEIVFNVVKNHFPPLLDTVRKMIADIESSRNE